MLVVRQIGDEVEYTVLDGKIGTTTARILVTIDGTAQPIDPSAGSLDQITFAELDYGEVNNAASNEVAGESFTEAIDHHDLAAAK